MEPLQQEHGVRDTLAQAMALHQQGQLQAAAALYRDILAVAPAHFDALHLLGVTALQQGETADAHDLLSQAIAIEPGNAAARMHFAHALQQQGQLEAALRAFGTALDLAPGDAVALNNCASLLRQMKRQAEALPLFERALAREPAYAEAWNNLGGTLVDLQRHEEALACFQRALLLQPAYADALYNRGNALQFLNRTGEALASYAQALRLNPDDVDARFNAGVCRLLQGDLEQGWPGYEWRWRKAAQRALLPGFADPAQAWRGATPAAGRRLLVWSEQGFGDTIQFCRYVPLLAARGFEVSVRVQPALKTLLGELPGARRVLAEGEPLPDFDLHCPMMSLPLACATTLENIPAAPRLQADAARAAAWARRLGAKRKKRIGLAWSGSGGHDNDAQRSIALYRFAALLNDGAEWISLQREARAADRLALEDGGLRDFAADLADFADTAALVAQLDLVVSVDTSVAHLAASMGKPVWLLLPFSPDWRWMLEHADSPWYPAMRLFRQPRRGDWDAVLADVAGALLAFNPDSV